MTTISYDPFGPPDVTAQRIGVANVLAMLSDLAMRSPDTLLAVIADPQVLDRWDELKNQVTGWPVTVDDVLTELGLTGCSIPERDQVDYHWTLASRETLDRLAGPLADALGVLARQRDDAESTGDRP